MKHSIQKTVIAFFVIFVAAWGIAEEWRVSLEPQATTVEFTLKATMHSVHGTAETVSGNLVFDPSSGSIQGDIIIDATSTVTGNTSRDKNMHTKVLRTEDYPRIVLHAQHIDGQVSADGVSEVSLVAAIDLLGQSHPTRIPLRISVDGGHFTAEAAFDIPYVEWGANDPSTFILRVAKQVRIEVRARGTVVVGIN